MVDLFYSLPIWAATVLILGISLAVDSSELVALSAKFDLLDRLAAQELRRRVVRTD